MYTYIAWWLLETLQCEAFLLSVSKTFSQVKCDSQDHRKRSSGAQTGSWYRALYLAVNARAPSDFLFHDISEKQILDLIHI